MSPTITTTTMDTSRGALQSASLVALRRGVWVVVCVFALLDAWTHRFEVYSDGVSYVEIARAYAQHDWSGAINAYWSPAISWLAALLFVVLRPSPEWELPTYHLVNLLAVIVSLPCYEFLLSRIESRIEIPHPLSFRIASYAIFVWTIQFLLYAGEFRPDPLLLAPVFLVVAFTLLPRNLFSQRRAIEFGALLAFCYFVKTAMFPVALIAIAVLGMRYGLRRGTAAGGCFLLLATPFVAVLTVHCGRFTLGESGKINYAWEVNGVRRSTLWLGGPHSPRLISKDPPVYAFDAPIPGSYPPWRDPAYFYDQVPVHFVASQEIGAIANNGAFLLVLALVCPGLVYALWPRKGSHLRFISTALWPMIVISACGIGLYSAVFVEKRYVAPFVVGVALPAIAAVALEGEEIRKNLCLVAIGTCAFFAIPSLVLNAQRVNFTANPYSRIATELRNAGLKPNARIAYVGHSLDAYWATLLGARITAECPLAYVGHNWMNKTAVVDVGDTLSFWHRQARGLDMMKQAGAVAVFADEVPRWADLSSWQRIYPDYDERQLWMRWLN